MNAATPFPRLFSPLRVGSMIVPNRVVFSAHLTNYAYANLPSEQHLAYYRARAAGGAGLIITEEQSTHPTDWPYEKLIHAYEPAVIPHYEKLTRAVHAEGARVLAQINHNGQQAAGTYTGLPVWGPSPVPDPMFREVPLAIGAAEIEEVVAGYARVAAHCEAGGFDGVELQCSHSSIVRQFLSPATNHRQDGYGGSLPNRLRLLDEILTAIRGTVAASFVVGVRVCGDELLRDGITLDEAVATSQHLERGGHVDYINTSIAVATANLFMIEASMHVPPGYALFIPAAIREAVELPVVGVGRIKDPVQAEQVLADGHADLVGVVRAQIADAEWAAKARAGRVEEIRLCLSCNQECVGRMGLNRWLGCITTTRTGREAEPAARPAPASRRVVVVGGGPAGLEAARAAGERGHDVVLLEREPELGGQVRRAIRVPNRAEFGDLVRNQIGALRRVAAGVDVRLGVDATADLVIGLEPDVVIVASGSEPNAPSWLPGWDAAVTLSTWAALAEPETLGQRVLFLDELGFHTSTSVAEHIADTGRDVTVCTPGFYVGQDLGVVLDLETWYGRARRLGMVLIPDVRIAEIRDGRTALLANHYSGLVTEVAFDTLVYATANRPVAALYHELRGSDVPVHRIGDCLAPRRAHAAVIEGDRLGSAV